MVTEKREPAEEWMFEQMELIVRTEVSAMGEKLAKKAEALDPKHKGACLASMLDYAYLVLEVLLEEARADAPPGHFALPNLLRKSAKEDIRRMMNP